MENKNVGNKIQVITTDLLESLLSSARKSPRLRDLLLLHQGEWEHMHRFLNAFTPKTYVRPHRHNDAHAAEGFVILTGRLAILIFFEDGTVDTAQSVVLDPATKNIGIDIRPGTWHACVALKESVAYETKGQPNERYVKEKDKEFAPWAPEENSAESAEYLEILRAAAQLLLAR